jgi:glycine/D-amino acid oxidase-like deaminating enzyme
LTPTSFLRNLGKKMNSERKSLMKKYDAIIIGAGVIGASIAYELSKKGYRVLSIDKNSDAGTGSTAGSCAIVRAHYSTYQGWRWLTKGSFIFWTGKSILALKILRVWPGI